MKLKILLIVIIVIIFIVGIAFLGCTLTGIPFGYRCMASGCSRVNGFGEFAFLNSCNKKCQSYIKKNGNCQIVKGMPVGSYLSQEVCSNKHPIL